MFNINAVGDYTIIARKEFANEVEGRLRDGDPTVELIEPVFEKEVA